MSTTVTLLLPSYNRPVMLRECIHALYRNPGEKFKLIIWDNGSNKETVKVLKELRPVYHFSVHYHGSNIGLRCLYHMIKPVKTKYLMLLEEDMIWFQPNWLKDLLSAFENPPTLTSKHKQEWGLISCNVMVDSVEAAGMWDAHLATAVPYEKNGIHYIANVPATGGGMLMRTKEAKKLKVAEKNSLKFKGVAQRICHIYNEAGYPQCKARDIYIYHASSPYYNQMYPEVFEEKQDYTQTIDEAFKIYKDKKEYVFDFSSPIILNLLKAGRFKEYADGLYEIYKEEK